MDGYPLVPIQVDWSPFMMLLGCNDNREIMDGFGSLLYGHDDMTVEAGLLGFEFKNP
jgi:hypothetical protein